MDVTVTLLQGSAIWKNSGEEFRRIIESLKRFEVQKLCDTSHLTNKILRLNSVWSWNIKSLGDKKKYFLKSLNLWKLEKIPENTLIFCNKISAVFLICEVWSPYTNVTENLILLEGRNLSTSKQLLTIRMILVTS